jgi:hypothetical protein
MNRALAAKGILDFWDHAMPLPNHGKVATRPYLYLKRLLPRRSGIVNRFLSSLFLSGSCRTEFVREQDAFFEALEAETDSKYYFDGCKSLVRAQLMRESYPDTKVLHLIRDPRGFIASCVKHQKEQTGHMPDNDFVKASLGAWEKYNTLAAGYERELEPGKYLRIQYADLLSEPERTLSGIVDFIGIDGDRVDLSRFDLERLHVSGNKTNLISTRIETRALGDWMKFSDSIDFEYIERRTRDYPFVGFEAAAPE